MIDQMLIYQIAIPLLIVVFLLLIWNEIHKRGDKVEVKLAKAYRWNRCFLNQKQGIIVLDLEMRSLKKRPVVIRDSGLEIIRNFQLPAPADHVPTIERIDQHNFENDDFLFAGKQLTFEQKGQTKSGLDVFLANKVPNKGKRLDVEYHWYDDKWRRYSRRFRIYLDRGAHEIVL